MGLLRLLVPLIYVAFGLMVALRRSGEARQAAAAAGATIERTVWCRSMGAARSLLLVLPAFLLLGLGGKGLLVAVVYAVLTAPLAASGVLRVAAITTRGLILDGVLRPWAALTGFAWDRARARLILWSGTRRDEVVLDAKGIERLLPALRARVPEIT